MCHDVAVSLCLLVSAAVAGAHAEWERPRVREPGLQVGIFDSVALNAITDVTGVRVGHSTRIEVEDIRTGVTAIISRQGAQVAQQRRTLS